MVKRKFDVARFMAAVKPPKKKSKYGNKITYVGKLRFDSAGEARRWCELRILEKAGHITDLTRQVRYPMVVNSILIGTYTADFVYTENDVEVVEDFKGKRTREYMRTKKLMRACHGIEIRETS